MTETGAPPKRGGWYFDRSRLRLAVVIGLIAGAIAFLLIQGLSNATMYFRNVDEAVAMRDELGDKRFRLQGEVVDGTVHRREGAVDFDLTFNGATVAVRHHGDPPELFKPGIPVVLEGSFADGSDVYESDVMRIRHTNEYRAENPDRVEPEAP